uniref:Uncharacterized protein n=1 Tax=Myotis myotis TaxID=51298 RepID=A0A7J7VYX5_MYOMY|nr:hypothetical protein mMyoMyo1_012200 [Myotis myotis]
MLTFLPFYKKNLHPGICLLIFRERKGQRARETWICYLRYMPRPGTQPATYLFLLLIVLQRPIPVPTTAALRPTVPFKVHKFVHWAPRLHNKILQVFSLKICILRNINVSTARYSLILPHSTPETSLNFMKLGKYISRLS